MKRRLLSSLLIIVMVLSLMPTPSVNAAKVKNPKLSSTKITLTVGKKKTLKLKNCTKISKKKIKKVKWSSSNKKVVSIKVKGKYKQNAVITAKKAGKVTIKLKYNGKTYKCKVVVKDNKKSTTTEEEKTTEKKEEVTTEKDDVTTEKKESTTEKEEESTTEKEEESTTEKEESTTEKEESTTENSGNEEPKPEIPTEHICSYGEWVVTTEATCTSKGVEKRTCVCGEYETRDIAQLKHTYGEWVVTTKATCKAEGIETRSCSCGKSETRTIAKVDHVEVNGGLISCHTKCSVCGLTIQNGDYHQYADTVVSEATCKKTGVLKHSCDCGYAYTETIPVSLEHTYNKEHQCSICGVFDEDSAYMVADVSEQGNDGIILYAYETQVYDADFENKVTAYDVYIKSFNSNCNIAKNPHHSESGAGGPISITGEVGGKGITLSKIHSLTFVNTVKAPRDCTHFLSNFGSDLYTQEINNLANLNTSDTTNMYGMFSDCAYDLYYIPFDTSNVTNMSCMFNHCTNIDYLSFASSFDTSKVTNMSSMFCYLPKCDYVEVEDFDTSNVTDMSDMFAYMGKDAHNTPCISLDLRNWDTSKVKDMSGMFYQFGENKGYYIQFGDKFSTESVTSISRMFDGLGKNWETNTNSNKKCNILLGETFLVNRDNIVDSKQYALFEDAYFNVYNGSNSGLSDDVKAYLESWGTVYYYGN